MPPKPGPPPRQVPRRRILALRFGVLGGVVLAGVIAFALVKITGGNSSPTPPPPTTVAAPKPFRIVFPEGFNRLEMAQRVGGRREDRAVETARPAGPADEAGLPRGDPPGAVVPGFGHTKRDLEASSSRPRTTS